MSVEKLSTWLVGGLLILAGLFFFLMNLGYVTEPGPNVWAVLFALAGLGFWAWYGADRDQWWAAIPGGALLGLAGTTVLATAGQPGELASSLLFLGIAAGFLPVFLRSPRQQWWALIPMGVMVVMAVVMLIASVGLSGGVIGFMLLSAIGLVFLGLYVFIPPVEGRRQWWPLIPAGALFTTGLIALAGDLLAGDVGGAVLFAGLGVTFGAIFLLRRPDTRWALYPALGCLAFAVFFFAASTLAEDVLRWWPVLIILGGVILLVVSLRERPG